MSTLIPPQLAPPATSSLYSFGPSALGASTPFDFSQILTDQLLGQTPGNSLGLPANAGLSSLNSGLGFGNNSMLETLMALSLVMLVERLVDQAPASATTPPTRSPLPVSTTQSKAAPPATTADAPNVRWPVAGRITQDFHPGHTGTDIAIPVGTPIPTTLAGKVVFAGWNTEGYGKLVIVENGPYRTYYAHLSQINVHAGDQLAQGAQIGYSGSTGNSTGPHLHYEVRINGTPVPPDQLP